MKPRPHAPCRAPLPWLPALFLVAGELLSCAPARAVSLRVTTPLDLADAAPGDGVCEATRGAGDCSLRAAIEESTWLPGADDVVAPPDNYSLVLSGADEDDGATGDLDIQGDLTLTCEPPGPCKVIAEQPDRCLHVLPGSLVVIDGFTLTGGSASSGPSPTSDHGGLMLVDGATVTLQLGVLVSGAARYGGGIAAVGGSVLQVTDTSFADCSATTGGGLWIIDSSARVQRTTITNCSATDVGGGIALEQASAAVGDCEISSNSAGRGGAVAALAGGTLSMEASLINSNQGQLQGGAFAVDGALVGLSTTRCESNTAPEGAGIVVSAGTLDLLKSSVTNNMAQRGGGVFMRAGTLRSLNSTLSGNKATGAADSAGGAILLAAPGGATAQLTFTTIAGNTAGTGGGLDVAAGSMSISNSIIAGNTATTGPDAFAADGALVSTGFNLYGDGAGVPPSARLPEDLVGVDPLLGALTQGRGYSLGMSPGALSPALDAADPFGCTDLDGGALASDQQGEARPVDGDGNGDARCDIGAIEWCGEDLDGNGVGDKCGCVPGDTGSIIVPPEPEIRAWRIQGFSHPLLTWTDLTGVAGALTTYQVAGEGIADLWRDRLVDGPCLIVDLVDERFEDVAPAATDVYYLVRGVNACGPGATQGWGKDSLGNPHLACP